MQSIKKSFIIAGFLAAMVSCVTSKRVTYLQAYDDSLTEQADSMAFVYKVRPSDNLYIRVITPDPKWSAMFNTLPIESPTLGVGEHAMDLISYTVQENGNVDIPYIGMLPVGGKSLHEIQELIDKALSEYISDADVTVKLINNYVSILGDVRQPGLYPIFKEKLTIFQALSMAGDAADFAERRQVRVIREQSGRKEIHDLDLTDRGIIHSEYYYVLPNDVIYVKPMKGKFFALNQFPYAIVISTLTTFLLFLSYIQPNP